MKNSLRNAFKGDYEKLKELPDLARAEVIIDKMFEGKMDKEGKPYIDHLYFVSNQVDTEDERVVGLLHDLLEDTDTSLLELQEIGFNDRVLSALILLTKVKGTAYSEYIDNLLNSNNLTAIKVKEADMRNNSDPERLKNLSPELQEKFTKKYSEPYKKIIEKIGELENDRYKINKR